PGSISRVVRSVSQNTPGGRADAADCVHVEHSSSPNGAKTLSRPLSARALPGTVVPLEGEALDDLRSGRGERRVAAVLHVAPRPLAVHAHQHAVGLALGSRLSATLRLCR